MTFSTIFFLFFKYVPKKFFILSRPYFPSFSFDINNLGTYFLISFLIIVLIRYAVTIIVELLIVKYTRKIENKIETVISPALEALKKFLQEGKKFDLVFIDADKGNYKNYYDLSLNLINAKALIIFDNVLWHGDVCKKTATDKQPI